MESIIVVADHQVDPHLNHLLYPSPELLDGIVAGSGGVYNFEIVM